MDWAACFDDTEEDKKAKSCNEATPRIDYADPDPVPLGDYGFDIEPAMAYIDVLPGKPTDPPVWRTYTFTLPSHLAGVDFYGGRLWMHFDTGINETFSLRMYIDGRPYLTQ
jgi:hypothetical protein